MSIPNRIEPDQDCNPVNRTESVSEKWVLDIDGATRTYMISYLYDFMKKFLLSFGRQIKIQYNCCIITT